MTLSLIPRSFWEDDDLLSFSNTYSGGGVSVSDDDKHVFVTAATPGVDEKDIEITFDKGTLWIKGETKKTDDDTKRNYYRRSSSSFAYQIAVPGELDQNSEPEAIYKNGVMTVKFTKTPRSQPKKIAIKSSN